VNEPARFRDAASDAPEELRRLFQAGAEDLPAEAELASLALRLGPVFEPPPSSTPIKLSTAGKVAAVSAAVVGSAVLFALNFGPHGQRPPDAPERWTPSETPPPASAELRPPAASADSAVKSATPESGAAAAPASAGATPSSSAPAAATAHPSGATARPVETEAELLERARGALASNPARALALTEQDRTRFPAGVLAQEREVIAIEALKRLGRGDEAARRAADFARRYPGSAYKKKLDTGRP
jgi:hypothetical protein